MKPDIFLIFKFLLCSFKISSFSIPFRSMQIPEAEGKSEILPPTIQKIVKGYNKYLRPFFDSK